MHDYFFFPLVDFSVNLFCYVETDYTKICKKKKKRKTRKKNEYIYMSKKKMFHNTFLQDIPMEDM